MNALTAIRQFVSPSIQPPRLPSADALRTPGATIPAAELKALPGASEVSSTSRPSAIDGSFGNMLGNLVNEVNAKQSAANQSANEVLTGDNVSLHQAVIAMEEASVSFQLMVEVRNKLLESYQEIMRMQV
jgi:flagellar hook-basal body complex protein FliE